jgi:YYY domain-containing protein
LISLQKLENSKQGMLYWRNLVLGLLLIATLIAGAYLRFTGVNWDEDQHMHPDERFLSLVQVSISPVENPGDYFNTAESSLNPANRGHTFFVYGTLPIFITRYLGDALGQVDYNAITLLGRRVSASFDVITILFVFFVGKRLYNKWIGLLGSIFYALAVLPIQLAHYATVDSATNTFAMIAVYGAVWALTRKFEPSELEPKTEGEADQIDSKKIRTLLKDLAPYLLFGVGLGAATASKINAVVFAGILPLVEMMRYLKMRPEQRQTSMAKIIRNLCVAGVISFVVFRIGQPYAFNGPGFLNLGINPNWWSSLQNLRVQASGDVDFPPALQWARRPITFSWQNLVAWGLGWPLGVFSWLAFLVMGYLIIKRKNWHNHLPLWLFTGAYFAWQSLAWVRSMRYQVLIYPLLAIFAGWGLVGLLTVSKPLHLRILKIKPSLIRILGICLIILILFSNSAWAYSFSQIYRQPHTRVAASRWIYQNIQGALTLEMETAEGKYRQPLPYRAGDTLSTSQPYSQPFIAVENGVLQSVTFPYILDSNQNDQNKELMLTVVSAKNPDIILATALVVSPFPSTETEYRGAAYTFTFNPAVEVINNELYYLELYVLNDDGTTLTLNGSPSMTIITNDGMLLESPLPRILQSVRFGKPYQMDVRVVKTGLLSAIDVPYLVDQAGINVAKELEVLLQVSNQEGMISSGILRSDFLPEGDIRGKAYHLELKNSLYVEAGQTLSVTLKTNTERALLVPHGEAPAHESSWDDAIPYPVDGFSPYSENGGIYRGDLNFEMYWADDDLKLSKFEKNLDLADYIFITSNRQWGTTTRVPERYPLTTTYYQALIGCPDDKEITWCYSVAEPGMFKGELGFELVETFDSNPEIGPVEINTQFAEEAFTVYDHPKVLIFKKTSEYDPIKMREILRSVNLDNVVYFTPGDAKQYKGPEPEQAEEPRYNLMLPDERLQEQRSGGTWSDLFDRQSLINQSQPMAVIIFYLLVVLLGLIAYPMVRMALPGLADRGYPLSRLAGLLLLAFISWILGSFGIPFSRLNIALILIGMLVVSGLLYWVQRQTIWTEIKENWRYYLVVEGLSLIAFLIFLLIRMGNPDLWHPWKGGEKPMDFSYLNAVLKSSTFPPYDPWFAGGYINYYYYGFVIVGTPIKLLGVIPATAYNIILPIWYSMMILGGFSMGWNLYRGIPQLWSLADGESGRWKVFGFAFWSGMASAIGLAVLGNLGTVRLINRGFQQIAAAGAVLEDAGFIQKLRWGVQGFVQFLKGTSMPFYPGDWYWYPSRVIPGDPITEFPFFTFIYADLHAHLIAFPITVFVVSWCFSLIMNRGWWGDGEGRLRWLRTALSILIGALVVGALRPTNTWDFYTYLVFSVIAIIYSTVRYFKPRLKQEFLGSVWLEKLGVALLISLGFVLLAMFLYQPFAYWFGQGYSQIDIWKGDRTPLGSYFTHWGLFLFVILSWMAWETYHWMKTTPMKALKRLEVHRNSIIAGIIFFFVFLVFLLIQGVSVAIIALPLGVWIVVLMLRPGRSDGHRFLLFMIGTAVALTLVVEVVYVPGDIGRMNTVFKFYLQAWILFALSAGVCFIWLIKSFRYWDRHLLLVEQALLFILIVSAALFPLLGTADKIRDRMAPGAPQNLDGMAYMQDATYYDLGEEMQLEEDYQAIQWLQDHVSGSPVILEGQAYEYRWGNRITIYTGLPGVVGWNWHQRQQRAILRTNIVQERVDAVNLFYNTEDISYVEGFLDRYDVEYIIVGQLERVFYPGIGLEKFQIFEGQLWNEVFRAGQTVIYQVID